MTANTLLQGLSGVFAWPLAGETPLAIKACCLHYSVIKGNKMIRFTPFVKAGTAVRVGGIITHQLPFTNHRVVMNIIQLLVKEGFCINNLGIKAFFKHFM